MSNPALAHRYKGEHSAVGASSMDRWEACPGSVRECESMPKKSSSYADEGTLAHLLGEIKIKERLFGFADDRPDISEFHDMEAAVDIYVDHVIGIWEGLKPHPKSKIMTEVKFAHPDIHPGFRGTVDNAIYDGENGWLYVTDYKHGAGVPVSVVNNSQASYYGLGIALMLKGTPIKRVILNIVQPRYQGGEPVQTWEIDTVDLMEFMDRILNAIDKTEDPNAPLVPGEKQCFFCAAKPKCPALREKLRVAVQSDFEVEKLPDLSPAVLGNLLTHVDFIEAWCKGVRSFAYNEAKMGRIPNGFKLVPKRATRKWTNIEEAQKVLTSGLNSNVARQIMTDPELRTPAQVEKIIGGKVGKDMVADLVSGISSGDNLVPESDDRQPVNKSDMAKALFGDN